MPTYNANCATAAQQWFVVDASNKKLGRLASVLAHRLRGKHKPIYTPHVDTGDFIVVINAEKLSVTGNKAQDKMYYHNTGHPGGMRSINFSDLMDKNPATVLEKAVKGMLPKGPLGAKMFSKLKVYRGAQHPHQAQNPQPLEIEEA